MIKCGTKITAYNRKDEIVDKSLRSEGLNEGITELLACKLNNEEPNAYDYQVYLADILINNNNSTLVKSYFSDDSNKFKEFLKDFEKRQSQVSSKELAELTTSLGEVMDSRLLSGCLDYSLSFCNTIDELKVERNRLLPIFKKMYENINIEFDDEFDLKQFFNDKMNQKRQEIAGRHLEEPDDEVR